MTRPLTSAQIKAKRKAIGAHLKAMRKGTGSTQRDVAVRAGLSLPPIGEIEGGATSYKVDSLIQICHANGFDLSDLIGSKVKG